MVMPTWAPDSWVDSERSARQDARDAGHRRPLPARPARSTVTNENSAATKAPARDQEETDEDEEPLGHGTPPKGSAKCGALGSWPWAAG